MLAQALGRLGICCDGSRQCHCPAAVDDAHGEDGGIAVYTDWHTREDVSALGYTGRGGSLGAHAPVVRFGQSADNRRSSSEASALPFKDGTEAATLEAVTLRELMKCFVQDMIRGKPYLVVVENGRTECCKLLLTPNLQYLQLQTAGVTHDIPLKSIKDICPGRSLESKCTPIPLDDMCSTVVLRNNECVTFRLGSLRERDDFTKCVKVLSLALVL